MLPDEPQNGEQAIATYLIRIRESISGTATEAALTAYHRVEPALPRTDYRASVRFATGSNK